MKLKPNPAAATCLAVIAIAIANPLRAGEAHDHAAGEPAGHEHAKAVSGPNGGRVLKDVEPHLEFFVTGDRKVRITAVDDDGKAVPLGEQSVTLIGGDRSKPTKMTFSKEGGSLVSDKAFPEGNDFPVVMQIKVKPDAKVVFVKFNLNLNDCPECKHREYACTCEHGADDHEGHNH